MQITKASPTSLKVTLEAWKRGKGASLKDCLVMEYRLMMRLQASNDFKEGIRALLVDKDNSPKWAPASLSLVSDSAVATYFDSLNPYDLSLS